MWQIFFFAILTVVESNEEILEFSENSYECAEKIYKKFYEKDILINNQINEEINFLNSSVVVSRNYDKNLLNKLWQHNFYIIIFDNIQKLNTFLNDLFNSPPYNPKGKFLLLFSGHKFPENIFEITWKYFIVNINLVYKNKIYTHFPYEQSCGTNTKPILISNCTNLNLYKNKIPRNLNGCEFKLMGLNIQPYVIDIFGDKNDPVSSGLEVTILHIIAKKMNFSEKYIWNPFPHWGYLMPDGNFTMMLKYLDEKKADIVFGKSDYN